VSDAVRDKAVRYGLDPEKTWLIRPAVDPDFFYPSAVGGEGGPLRVLIVGRLFWTKGHEYALQAIRLLLDRGVGVRLDVIGDGPERDRVVGTVQDLELGDAVELHGRLAQGVIRGHMHGADLLLQPSMVEGIANTVLEAMACGLPVVVTDCDGMREAVTDGRQGLVVPPRNPTAIAHALETLAGDPERRMRMGAAGRERVLSEFSVDDQVDRIVTMYESVVGRYAGASR
jgi:colanic acid/amylovoran biosynthesis glycosyltransferase